MRRSRTLLGLAAVAAVAATSLGASAATAADRPAALTDILAARLGISAGVIEHSSRVALVARVNAAVKAGKLTAEQGTRLKVRIATASRIAARNAIARKKTSTSSDRVSVHGLNAAAAYLDLSVPTLRAHLLAGESLAQVAAANDKSVDGLVAAILVKAKKRIAQAVESGQLNRKRAKEVLKRLTVAAEKLVKSTHAGG
ncbi:MAG TPA: hypothetical protein VJT76_01210 [Gaiella sp.]|nr:hypothetical protein [Gaiella sp.]